MFVKLRKISEITATLPFTEFDFMQKYRESFAVSELGRIHAQLPLKELGIRPKKADLILDFQVGFFRTDTFFRWQLHSRIVAFQRLGKLSRFLGIVVDKWLHQVTERMALAYTGASDKGKEKNGVFFPPSIASAEWVFPITAAIAVSIEPAM